MASDAEVMVASIAEPAVFGEIFDRHAAPLLRFLARRVGPEPAQDLLGDVFRVGFERRASFDPSRSNARPWLYGIASNLLLKHRRAEARRLQATARLVRRTEVAAASEDGVIDELDAGVLLPRVAEAIASLPDGERDALLLFAWEDLSYEDIATALGVPVGTVRSRLNRARKRLRELTSTRGKQAGEPTIASPGEDRR